MCTKKEEKKTEINRVKGLAFLSTKTFESPSNDAAPGPRVRSSYAGRAKPHTKHLKRREKKGRKSEGGSESKMHRLNLKSKDGNGHLDTENGCSNFDQPFHFQAIYVMACCTRFHSHLRSFPRVTHTDNPPNPFQFSSSTFLPTSFCSSSLALSLPRLPFGPLEPAC